MDLVGLGHRRGIDDRGLRGDRLDRLAHTHQESPTSSICLIRDAFNLEKDRMAARNEHDDDLEPEVIEGAEIETEEYEEADDEQGIAPGTDVTNSSDRAEEPGIPGDAGDEEAPDDNVSDTI
jgi:hypothetical protein